MSQIYPNLQADNERGPQPNVVYQPVLTQSPRQPVSMPIQPQEKKAANPVDLVKHYSRRLKCTSWTLVVIGAVGVAMAFFHGFNARRESYDILHRPPHGGPNHHPQPHLGPSNHTGNEPVTEAEFAVYDILKTMSFVSFFISMAVLHMGKQGLWAIKADISKHPFWVNSLKKRTIFKIIMIIILCIVMCKQGHNLKKIVKKTRGPKGHHNFTAPAPIPSEEDFEETTLPEDDEDYSEDETTPGYGYDDNEQEDEDTNEFDKRNLRASREGDDQGDRRRPQKQNRGNNRRGPSKGDNDNKPQRGGDRRGSRNDSSKPRRQPRGNETHPVPEKSRPDREDRNSSRRDKREDRPQKPNRNATKSQRGGDKPANRNKGDKDSKRTQKPNRDASRSQRGGDKSGDRDSKRPQRQNVKPQRNGNNKPNRGNKNKPQRGPSRNSMRRRVPNKSQANRNRKAPDQAKKQSLKRKYQAALEKRKTARANKNKKRILAHRRRQTKKDNERRSRNNMRNSRKNKNKKSKSNNKKNTRNSRSNNKRGRSLEESQFDQDWKQFEQQAQEDFDAVQNWGKQFGDHDWKKFQNQAEEGVEDMKNWGKKVGQSVENRVEKHTRGQHSKHDDWAAKHGQPRQEGGHHMPPTHHQGHSKSMFGKIARIFSVIVQIMFFVMHCHFLKKLIQAKKVAQNQSKVPVVTQVQVQPSSYDYSVYLPKTEEADMDKEEHPVIKIEQSPQSYVINSGSNQMN